MMKGKAERGAGIMAGMSVRRKEGIGIEVIMEESGTGDGAVVETVTGKGVGTGGETMGMKEAGIATGEDRGILKTMAFAIFANFSARKSVVLGLHCSLDLCFF
jgi:hypothetical protein